MATGQGLFVRALEHVGEPYILGASVPMNNPNWHGPWDCAEFMSWLVFQEAHFLYGCVDDTAMPAKADAYSGAWERDSGKLGRRIGVREAAGIVGAMLIRFPVTGRIGHVVLCDSHGGTVEAHGHADGVIRGKVDDRWWDTGVLVPGISYDESTPPYPWRPPATVYRVAGKDMDPKYIRDIQSKLHDLGINPGPISGVYDENTAVAVAAFQAANKLLVDGQVGQHTAAALGLRWG